MKNMHIEILVKRNRWYGSNISWKKGDWLLLRVGGVASLRNLLCERGGISYPINGYEIN